MVHLRKLAMFLVAASSAANASLKPWEITRLSTFSPPDRPGAELSSSMGINITDTTNYTDPASAPVTTCSAKWVYGTEPYGQSFNCTDVEYGVWTFEILKASTGDFGPTQDFGLLFLLRRGVDVFEGSARFTVGDNMRGLCSAAGMCSFQLKEEMTPFYINQTRRNN